VDKREELGPDDQMTRSLWKSDPEDVKPPCAVAT
jgi:hypothetical protein